MKEIKKFLKSIKWIYVLVITLVINLAISFDKPNVGLYIFANFMIMFMIIYAYLDKLDKQASKLKREQYFNNITPEEILTILKERNDLDFLFQTMQTFINNYSRELFDNDLLDVEFGNNIKSGLLFYKNYLKEIGYF